uniref:Putative reverse transcriptase domain-containing protein n=1 Tax=Tanacetum cinerariifolium TaxID=118510 RepID=A0A699H7H1_TANCI|nr:putative reverse transcriptase domain-containing protein [Tanacetum cinerariifolium]
MNRAKDAKVIDIGDQLLMLIKTQVETELMLEEKFKDLYEKKCLSDEPLTISLDEIRTDDKLHYVEESVDREVKRLKKISIPIIKVR